MFPGSRNQPTDFQYKSVGWCLYNGNTFHKISVPKKQKKYLKNTVEGAHIFGKLQAQKMGPFTGIFKEFFRNCMLPPFIFLKFWISYFEHLLITLILFQNEENCLVVSLLLLSTNLPEKNSATYSFTAVWHQQPQNNFPVRFPNFITSTVITAIFRDGA